MEEAGKEENYRTPANGKLPHTTIQNLLTRCCPTAFSQFLWSEPSEFRFSKFFFGFGIGAMFGIAFYFLIVDRIDLYEDHKIYILYGISSVMGLGWSVSAHYRCTVLIMVPNMLGGEGRGILLMLLIAVVMEGPILNIEKNIEEVSESMGCTVELQINHTRQLWKMMMEPVKNIILNMKENSQTFGNDTRAVKNSFRDVNDQIVSREGFVPSVEPSMDRGNISTQKLYEMKTKLRCEYIVGHGIERCKLWFDTKHAACMEKLVVPLFNHLFCLPMTFTFLCNIMKVMTPWCKDRIPVDSNFGQLYDKVNGSVDKLNQDFTVEMAVNRIEQESIIGAAVSKAEITETVREELLKKRTLLEKIVLVFKLLMSLSVFILLISSFLYVYNFNRDIRYDNIYVSTYFRQIDARRRGADRRHLLPLRKAERPDLIFPWQVQIHQTELRSLVLGIVQYIPIILVLIAIFILDWLLFTMLDIIQRHSYLEYNFSESHQLKIEVEGASILADLIRRTVAAFNTTIDVKMESNNLHCLPKPHKMKQLSIFISVFPMAGMILFCFFQIYIFRFRRVIAAFCFPKREKQRILFLYNELLRKRISYAEAQRKKIIAQARRKELWQLRGLAGTLHRLLPCLQRFMRKHCVVCGQGPTDTSYHCPNMGCGAMYCRVCWKDLRRFCFACLPFEEFVSGDSDNENSPAYGS
ncbi:E3 ubiquitin-protein ligase DCST1 [Narcine bancroftii]|uniref:E3 ubiquitin-protein ligase DCST1 n=1 Tax=Narcine bancroftii TaxID=1343680 RepID=UPI003831B70A